MINYDSILSAFDGKPTLLQWLKLVKKALDESVLKDITVSQDGASAVFTFNFEDGTSISTPAVTLPKGDTGAKGDKGDTGVSVTGVDEVSNAVVGNQTLTTLRFNFSNGTNNEVVVHAENGKDASGGGKLYLHSLVIQGGEYNLFTVVYNNTNTQITTIEALKKFISDNDYANIGTITPSSIVSFGVRERDSLGILIVVGVESSIFFVPTNIVDTVTEL